MSAYIELKNQIEQAISERITEAERLTDDQAEIATILGDAGQIAVYIEPPEITYQTWHIRQATFTVHLIHPVRDDEHEALNELLELVERLEHIEPWGLEEARPAMFAGEIPEYIIKITA
ncbi:hypothetical protein [Rothia sp. L_38]|uniref:hypothetical protein n=1 Tax=Rothia sp. L_38 TaxID=3422315 RepID=UPI003D6A1440